MSYQSKFTGQEIDERLTNAVQKDDIVNNLTDGGADKALSAEMGKEIAKNSLSHFYFNQQGKYLNPNGSISTTTSSNAITDYLPVKYISETMQVKGRSTAYVALYAFYNKDKYPISSVYGAEYNGVIVSVNNIPENAEYIVVNGNGDGTDMLHGYSFAKYLEDINSSLISKLSALEENTNVELVAVDNNLSSVNKALSSTEDLTYIQKNGYYKNNNGVVQWLDSDTLRTVTIDIEENDVIETNSEFTPTQYVIWPLMDDNGNIIEELSNFRSLWITPEMISKGATAIGVCYRTTAQSQEFYVTRSRFVDIANLREKVNEVENIMYNTDTTELGSDVFNIPNYYINSNTGAPTYTTSASAITDFIEIDHWISVSVHGRNLGGLVASIAFYNENKEFISAVTGKDEVVSSEIIPDNACYIRATGYGDGTDYIVVKKVVGLVKEVEDLQADVQQIKELQESSVVGNILLTGASFAYPGNQWPQILADMLNVNLLNRAISGTSILDTARKMYERTLYSDDEMEDFEILMVMHVHNLDVASDVLEANYTDYENDTYFPSEYTDSKPANMTYSQAYDYVFKKYAADCYLLKNNENSKWHEHPAGKPCNIVCLTHWHDARTYFNESIRSLKEKWGFHLIEIDKFIGFSKNQVHPVTGEQTSIIHSVDTETIDGTIYGWHPSRSLVGGKNPQIQERIATIVANGLKNLPV